MYYSDNVTILNVNGNWWLFSINWLLNCLSLFLTDHKTY